MCQGVSCAPGGRECSSASLPSPAFSPRAPVRENTVAALLQSWLGSRGRGGRSRSGLPLGGTSSCFSLRSPSGATCLSPDCASFDLLISGQGPPAEGIPASLASSEEKKRAGLPPFPQMLPPSLCCVCNQDYTEDSVTARFPLRWGCLGRGGMGKGWPLGIVPWAGPDTVGKVPSAQVPCS